MGAAHRSWRRTPRCARRFLELDALAVPPGAHVVSLVSCEAGGTGTDAWLSRVAACLAFAMCMVVTGGLSLLDVSPRQGVGGGAGLVFEDPFRDKVASLARARERSRASSWPGMVKVSR